MPERRQELTTEGGLNVVRHIQEDQEGQPDALEAGIEVSLFIAPDKRQIDAASSIGIKTIELHTGSYAQALPIVQLLRNCSN